MKRFLVLGFVVLAPMAAVAQVTVPNSFASGEIISASAMNDNFSAITDAVNPAGAAGNAGSLLPIGFVLIDTDGTKLAGTPNITTVRVGLGAYNITIAGEAYDPTRFVVLAMPDATSSAVTAMNFPVGTDVQVAAMDHLGAFLDTRMHVVIWKP